jgi:hypothetical protein
MTIQVQITDPLGNVAFGKSFTNQSFMGTQPVNVMTTWTPPLTSLPGTYTVQVGVFSSSGTRLNWNANATTFAVL